jgi:glycosyltransferase involved in cell wall biosynthesis
VRGNFERSVSIRFATRAGSGGERYIPLPVMRILFVHEVNYRRKVVYEIHDFPELLSLRGHDVTFIDFPEGERRVGVARVIDIGTVVETNVSRAHDGGSVRLITPGRVTCPPLDRLLASITQVPAIARELRHNSYDAVVLYGVPTNGWQTVLLARRAGVPVLFRAIDISHELRSSVYRRLIRWAERFVVRRVDAISANNEALRRYVIDEGADPARVTVDYPGLDLDRFAPGARSSQLGDRYGIRPDDQVIVFMGTFFRFAGLDWFLDGIAPAVRERPNLKVLLVGGGEADADLRRQVAESGLNDVVIFTGFVDYAELTEHLRLGDVAINPFDELLVTNAALPGKILQYAGCGIPTVCTRLDGMRGLIPDGDGVVYRAPGTEFVNAVLQWLDDDTCRRAAGGRARAVMEERCRWESAVAGFEARIRAITTTA